MTTTLEPAVRDERTGAVADDPAPPARARVVLDAVRTHARPRRAGLASPAFVSLAIVCLLALWGVAYALFFSGVEEARDQKQLYNGFRAALAAQTVPLGGSVAPGTAVAMITAQDAGVRDAIVVEGTAGAQLTKGPGHLRTSPLPGQAGTSYVFGRSVTFGGPFGNIGSLLPGDPITVVTQQGSFTYAVDSVLHNGDALPPPLTNGGRLVLVTSEGSGWLSGWAPSKTLYVFATLRGNPVVGTAPPMGTPPQAELPMHRDTGSLVLIVLGLQGLLLSVVATLWASSRWSSRQLWLVATPVLFAALWFVTQHAAQLLPNLV